MRLLNWPGPEVKEKRTPEYEWAYIKAYLEGQANERTQSVYTAMYGTPPVKECPFWLVRLAIYYGALKIGYDRVKRVQPSIEREMLGCVSRLDQNELKNNPKLIRHVRLHDFEDAVFGGTELTV